MQLAQTTTADPMADARDRLNIVSFLEEVRGIGEPPKQKTPDALSAVLTNEQGGVQLYQTFSQQASDPELKKAWKDFGEETKVHVQVCERAISMDSARIVRRDEDMHVEWNAAMHDWTLEEAATGR